MKTIYKVDKMDKLSPVALTLVAVSILSALYYLSYILNSDYIEDLLLYMMLVVIELYVVVTSVFTWWTILFHEKGRIMAQLSLDTPKKQSNKTKVALLFLTHAEPIDLVEKALISVRDLNTNVNVYLGDDGRRPEVERLCVKYDVTYVTRSNNKYFKSGNINNILKNSDEEFIGIFDIDHIPYPEFFEQTLPYFEDKQVGFVQAPQFYYNTNNLISKGASGSQNVFYELIMPGKNSFNSTICVGTNVVFRKKALDEALGGGIYLIEHSEDIYTGLALHERGWKSVYVPKVLAEGLAPDSLSAFFKQQLRWARGGFSLLFHKNILFSTNLNIEQKMQYFFSAIHYFSGFVILFYFALPIIFLFTSHKPLVFTEGNTWVLHYLPFFISKFVLTQIYLHLNYYQKFLKKSTSKVLFLLSIYSVLNHALLTFWQYHKYGRYTIFG